MLSHSILGLLGTSLWLRLVVWCVPQPAGGITMAARLVFGLLLRLKLSDLDCVPTTTATLTLLLIVGMMGWLYSTAFLSGALSLAAQVLMVAVLSLRVCELKTLIKLWLVVSVGSIVLLVWAAWTRHRLELGLRLMGAFSLSLTVLGYAARNRNRPNRLCSSEAGLQATLSTISDHFAWLFFGAVVIL